MGAVSFDSPGLPGVARGNCGRLYCAPPPRRADPGDIPAEQPGETGHRFAMLWR